MQVCLEVSDTLPTHRGGCPMDVRAYFISWKSLSFYNASFYLNGNTGNGCGAWIQRSMAFRGIFKMVSGRRFIASLSLCFRNSYKVRSKRDKMEPKVSPSPVT